MAKFKIEYDEEKCIGCSACEAQCPSNWGVKEKNGQYKAEVKNKELDEVGCNKDAVEVCPTDCIKIVKIG